jgi:hypothetical protein
MRIDVRSDWRQRTRGAYQLREDLMTTFGQAARRLLLGAPLIVLAAAIAHAEVGDADALRGMAQAEKDAGRVSGFHVVELYRVIGVTAAPSMARASAEAKAEAAREWAKKFCAAASRDFRWDHRWKLIVYAHGQPHSSYSCAIMKTAQCLERSPSSEGPTACDDKGSLLFDEID